MTEWMRGNELEKRAGQRRSRRHDAARRLCGGARRAAAGSPRSTAATEITERHRHRYEVNIDYRDRLEQPACASPACRPTACCRRSSRYAGPSLVHRRAVPSRAEIAAVRAAPAVHLLHPGRGRAVAAGLTRSFVQGAAEVAYPCRHDGRDGLRVNQPQFRCATPCRGRQCHVRQRSAAGADRRPCQLESRAHALRNGAGADGDRRQARHRAHLQDLVRQGEPHRARARAASASTKALPIFAEIRETLGIAGADRRARAPSNAPRSPRRSMCCRSRPSSAARPICCSRPPRPAGRQRQEGPVPRAVGHGERRRQDRRRRQSQRAADRARRVASATTRWSPTCARCRSWRETGAPVMFDATHSVQQPGGQGDVIRRRARIRAGAGARRGRGRRRRRVHRDPSGSRPRAVRRSQHGAAARDSKRWCER